MFWSFLSAPINYDFISSVALQLSSFSTFYLACIPLLLFDFGSAELWFSTDAKFEDKVVLPLNLSSEFSHTLLSISHLPIVLCYNGSLFELTSHESSTITDVDVVTNALVLNKPGCPNPPPRRYGALHAPNDVKPIAGPTHEDANAHISPSFRLNAENDSFLIGRYDANIPLQSIPERLLSWLLSGQRVHVRLFPYSSDHGRLHTSAPSISSASGVPDPVAISAGHVATVMVYVLLTSLLLFVLISIFGLLGYIGQRVHRTHRMRRSSHRLTVATRKALKKLTLRTLLPTDKEVLSGCDQCAICIELYRPSDVVRILPCRHVYHKRCIDPWLLEQYSCPLCKLDILKSCGVPVDQFRVSDHSDSLRLSSEHSSSASSATDRFGHPVGGGPISWTRWGHRPIQTISHHARSASRCDRHCDRPLFRSCTRDSHSPDAQDLGYSFPNIVFGSKQQANITSSAQPTLLSAGRWTCLSHFLWLCSFCFSRRPEQDAPACSDCCDSSCSSFTRNCDIPSDDRLCSEHASVLGVSLLPNILQLAQWRWYESHRKALEQHLTDVEACRRSACMGFVPNHTAPKHDGLTSRSTIWNVRLLCFHFPSRGKTKAPTDVQSISRLTCSVPKRSTPTSEATTPLRVSDARSPGAHEAKVVVHWSKVDGRIMGTDGTDQQHSLDVVKNYTHSVPASHSCLSPSYQLECYGKQLYISNDRRSAPSPVVTISNTSSASSTDGSSEPSLVVLQPSMLRQAHYSAFNVGSRITHRTKEQPPLPPSSIGGRHPVSHPFASHRAPSKLQSKRTRLSSHPYYNRRRTHFSSSSRNRRKRMFTASGTQLSTRIFSSKFDVFRELACFSRPFWYNQNKSTDTESRFPMFKVEADAPPLHGDATPNKQLSTPGCASSNLRMPHIEEMDQPLTNPMIPYSPLCPMCRSERGVKLFKACSSTRLSKPFCASSHDTRFSTVQTTGIEGQKMSCDSRYSKRRFSSPTDSVPTQSFDPRAQTPHSIHTGFVQSEHTDTATDLMSQPQLCGIRVTIEPPEVQYHRGPSNSDFSAESPTECSDSNLSLMGDNPHGYESSRSII